MTKKTVEPVQCALWKDPLVLKDPERCRFEDVKVYEKSEHLDRILRKCGQCGQLYLYEYYEDESYSDDDGDSYVTYLPVIDEKMADELNKEPPMHLLEYFPRLQRDGGADPVWK